MNQRCTNPRHHAFASYGGRGIRIAAVWRHDFAAFLAYIGPRPSRAYSLDRIDNSKGYEPGNVQWATKAQQARNCRSTIRLTHNDETHPLHVWAERLGVSTMLLHNRRRLGWTDERIVTTPKHPRRPSS